MLSNTEARGLYWQIPLNTAIALYLSFSRLIPFQNIIQIKLQLVWKA
jgi:hypothetical protein